MLIKISFSSVIKNSIHYYYHFSLLSLSQCSLCKKPILNILQFLLYSFLGNRYVTWFLHSYSITRYYYNIIISHFTRTNFNTYWNTLRERKEKRSYAHMYIHCSLFSFDDNDYKCTILFSMCMIAKGSAWY